MGVKILFKGMLNSSFSLLGIPFQQLPALEVDGKVIVGQSMAIARYIARYTNSKNLNNWNTFYGSKIMNYNNILLAGRMGSPARTTWTPPWPTCTSTAHLTSS